jgi:5-formyltetrahydrofolate cyclo-ligase
MTLVKDTVASPLYDGHMTTREDKAELRAFVRLTRAARSSNEMSSASTDFERFLVYLSDQYGWRRIAAFIPTPTEPPIAHGLNTLVKAGVSVIVPVSVADGLLDWVELAPDAISSTTKDIMGMPIPSTGVSTSPSDLDAVLIPAAAVDRDGNRLGWGKGFYDRFLPSIDGDPLLIAVVFDSDCVDQVPTEAHDAPIDVILTQSEIVLTQ